MGRTSRKSIYQAGYPAEPGQLETTGSFSPNIESTRIGLHFYSYLFYIVLFFSSKV